jgi:dihydrofolate reductase
MSILRAQLFISLDGVVEAPERWHFPYLDERMTDSVEKHFLDADALLLGRTTFDIFAASWANRPRETELARRINSIQKIVVTSHGDLPVWENSTTLASGVADGVARVKAEARAPIVIAGSVSLVRSLLALRLLDELQLMIHPIVLGSGERLFLEGTEQIPLALASAETYPTGVVDARYVPLHEAPSPLLKE